MADAWLSSVTRMVESSASWILSPFHRSSPSSPASPWAPSLQVHLEKLRRMLPRIQAVLRDAEEREIQDESIKHWLREIKDVAYEADDVLDLYQYELRRAEVEALPGEELGQVSDLNTCSSMDASFWSKITCRVEEITYKFDEISKQSEALRLRAGLGERRCRHTWARPPSTHMSDVSSNYGREKDINNLIKKIFAPGGDNPSVIAVVGMGGVGKTTLVQHVYSDQAVCEHFESRSWVCVSDDFDVVKLTKGIVEAVTKEPCELNEFSVLQEKLVREFSGKRFLLVLDDLWNQDPSLWRHLQAPLRYGSPGSAVILTTRSKIVAQITQTMPPIRLGCLSFDDCWAIFQQHAFHGQVPSDSQELLEVGKEIVRKCKGLPLACTTLGGLLRYEPDVDKWEDVLTSDVWDLNEKNTINILPILMLSYIYLPSDLKRCFAYCAVFPEDFSFTKPQLVRLWMAQGLIQAHRSKQLEEVGVQCFDELLQRSLFQLSHEYSPEHEQRFVMHDLIHDLAVSVSGRECFTIKGEEAWRLSREKHLLRHIAFVPYSHDVTATFQSLCCDGLGRLRSLLLLRRTDLWRNVVTGMPDAVVRRLESLRALDLSYIHLQHLPVSIGNLKHLRYLDLSGTRIGMLPESIFQLYLLQTMDLSYARIRNLPDSIKNLKELRYVSLCHTGIRMLPETIGELTNLQSLDLGYTSINRLPESVGKLRHLTHLDLSGTEITRFPEPVCMLCNLQTLNLNNVAICELPDSIGNLQKLRNLNLNETAIQTLPENFCKLHRLQILNLSFSRIQELPESIGNLGRLCHLDLSDTPVTMLPASICKIYNLQSLALKSSGLRSLPDEIGGLTNLQHLDFFGSDVYMPRGIGRLTSLRTLPAFNVGEGQGGGCRIEELMNLTELRGRLHISGLCRVINPGHATMANLATKTQIDNLALNWESDSGSCSRLASEVEQTYVFEKLRPPSSLTGLEVRGYVGTIFPMWMGDPSFSRLVQLVLGDCPKCRYLPPLGQLPSLKQLRVLHASSVESVGPEFRTISGTRRGAFPSLEMMTLRGMARWESWEGVVEGGDFRRLAHLELEGCPSLRGDLPNSSQKLPMLRVLKLKGCDSLEYVPLHNLPNLTAVELKDCKQLAHIDFGDYLCSPSSSSSSSPSSSSATVTVPTECWALRNLWIKSCPIARFLPEDGHLLPRTLTYLYIESDCHYLLDWCKGDGRSWVAKIPGAKIWKNIDGRFLVWTVSEVPYGSWKRDR